MMTAWVADLFLLWRMRVTLMVGASTGFGYLLLRPRLEADMAFVVAGTVLLAGACSLWNQAQEKATDALMLRTRHRPIARGSVSARQGVLWGAVLLLPALALLWGAGGMPLLVLGCLITLLYNGIYTPLKKRTCFSLLPGAVVGALPPVAGWMAAGGSLGDPFLGLVYGVYLLWQIPHFWLRVEKNREDYVKAGLPLPSVQFSVEAYNRLRGMWLLAFACSLLLLPIFPFMHMVGTRVGLTLLGLGVLTAVFFVGKGQSAVCPHVPEGLQIACGSRRTVAVLDGAMLGAMGCILADRFLLFVR